MVGVLFLGAGILWEGCDADVRDTLSGAGEWDLGDLLVGLGTVGWSVVIE